MQTDTYPRPHPLNRNFRWQDVPAGRPLRRLTPEQVEAFDRDGTVAANSSTSAEE